MKIVDQIRAWLEEEGRKGQWLSKKLGITFSNYHTMMHNTQRVPMKRWQALIEATSGHIKFFDLLSELYKDSEVVEIFKTKSSDQCIISLKKIKEEKTE